MKSAVERFMEKVMPEPNSGCWLWLGCVISGGYGQISCGGKAIYAHRFSYETFIGIIPDNLQIDHLCRVRSCVNPAHLEAVTMHENILRGVGYAAKNGRKAHCLNGHKYTKKNTYLYKDGRRNCRICRAAQRKEWQIRAYITRHNRIG